jgi:hypothetical protein
LLGSSSLTSSTPWRATPPASSSKCVAFEAPLERAIDDQGCERWCIDLEGVLGNVGRHVGVAVSPESLDHVGALALEQVLEQAAPAQASELTRRRVSVTALRVHAASVSWTPVGRPVFRRVMTAATSLGL